jgi:hypothetical protein
MTSNVLLNGLTFVQNLANVQVKDPGSLANAYNDIVTNILGGSTTQVDAFLAQYNKNTTPLPTTFSGFVSALYGYLNAHGVTPSLSQSQLETDLVTDYANSVNGIGSSSTDWSAITPAPTTADMQTQFEAWFAHLLTNYPYQSDGSVGSFSTFVANADADLTTTVALQNGSTLYTQTGVGTVTPIPTSPALPTYQEIYDTFFPGDDASGTNFKARLSAFYASEVSKLGYFSPSQAYADWTRAIQVDFQKSQGSGNVLTPATSLDSSNFQKTIILNQIFVLVASMLNTLQRTAAIQANRLTILTQWQQAYTAALAQIHVFQQRDGTTLADVGTSDPNATTKANIRQELNNNTNAPFQTTMQNEQNVISDDAKALQSSISQTNDSVSQQANTATSFLQELGTLLTAIYH